jgi:hypothetical protein
MLSGVVADMLSSWPRMIEAATRGAVNGTSREGGKLEMAGYDSYALTGPTPGCRQQKS